MFSPQHSPDRDSLGEPALVRPHSADEHRRELLSQLPTHLAEVVSEPLGPPGLAGATGPGGGRERDTRTAQALRDFAQLRTDPLPVWDFDR